jgi:hypothetical protein
MMMNPKRLSELIRKRKRELTEGEPEVVTTNPMPRNADDVATLRDKARIEATLNTPEKSQSNETDGMSEEDALTLGETSEQKTRMARLRRYFDSLEAW